MRRKLLIVATLIALAGVALAEVVYDANKPLLTAPGNFLSVAISSADASSYDTPVRPRLTYNNPKVIFAPTGSVHGAVACFEIVVYHRSVSNGVNTDTYETIAAVQTITFNSLITAGGRYPSKDGYILAPTLGCEVYDVRLRSISSGNANGKAWALGPDTKPSTNVNE